MVLRTCVVPDAALVLETGCDITGTQACKAVLGKGGMEKGNHTGVWKHRGLEWHRIEMVFTA